MHKHAQRLAEVLMEIVKTAPQFRRSFAYLHGLGWFHSRPDELGTIRFGVTLHEYDNLVSHLGGFAEVTRKFQANRIPVTQAGEHFLDAFQCLDNRTSLHLNYAYDKEVLRVYESQDSAAMCELFCVPKDSVLPNIIDAHGWDAFPMIMDVLERETITILDEEELIVDTVSDIASLAIGGFIDFDACESILPKVRGISRIAESAFEPLRVLNKGSEQIYLDWFLSDLENLFTTWLRGMGCTPKKMVDFSVSTLTLLMVDIMDLF